MPHFYFDRKNEEQLPEDDCFEFASTDEATRHAIRYLAEAAADNVTHLTPTKIQMAFFVTSANGVILVLKRAKATGLQTTSERIELYLVCLRVPGFVQKTTFA